MGLNDSFSQIHGQLLLLDPLPPINKVFSLVAQVERQRTVSSHMDSGRIDPINGLAFALRNEAPKRSTIPDAQYFENNRN